MAIKTRLTFHCRHCSRPVPNKRNLQLCPACCTEPIWLLGLLLWRDNQACWQASAAPFDTELDAAWFASEMGAAGGLWTHVINFRTRKLTPVKAYGFRNSN